MVCKTNCAIASALLGGMVLTIFNADKNVFKAYTNTFTSKQLAIQQAISKNRALIWMQGIIIGLIAGLMYLYIFSNGSNNLKGCLFAAIVMGVNYFYYMLADKGTYMVQHLREDQMDEYIQVKKMMQGNYHIGMIIGIVGCFFLGKGLSK